MCRFVGASPYLFVVSFRDFAAPKFGQNLFLKEFLYISTFSYLTNTISTGYNV